MDQNFDDHYWMRRAINLATNGMGMTYPNPIVGAVLISENGQLISQGFHQGREHAEVLALMGVGKSAVGATLYVSLEPCAHHGKTPPCTDAIISTGVSRVCYAASDPNPIAAGGASILTNAKIKVLGGIEKELAEDANRDWLSKIANERARFVWKVATSLDAQIAAADGSSKWITGEAARADVAVERSRADAIVVSTGTVLADNPTLTSKGIGRNPVRIVMGQRSIPTDFNIYSGDAETIFIKSHEIDDLLAKVRERNFNRILIESGPILGTALLKADLIDEIILYQAPTFLGDGISLTKNLSISNIKERIDFEYKSFEKIGTDLKTILYKKVGN